MNRCMFPIACPHTQKKGFTIIELIVTISIFAILSAVLITQYGNFDRRLTVDVLAHQVAQWVRDAQVSAMSVRRSAIDAGQFPGYGLHFERALPTEFIFFADLNGNHAYDIGGTCGTVGSECEEVVTMYHGNYVAALCGASPSVSAPASDCPSDIDNADFVDIVFTRPNPDAVISGEYAAGALTLYSRAQIIISSNFNYQRTVEVWTTGQVTVK